MNMYLIYDTTIQVLNTWRTNKSIVRISFIYFHVNEIQSSNRLPKTDSFQAFHSMHIKYLSKVIRSFQTSIRNYYVIIEHSHKIKRRIGLIWMLASDFIWIHATNI